MNLPRLLALLSTAILISACGGGGSDNASQAANTPPVASAEVAQSVAINAVVTLDGSASSDANGDTLRYEWTLTSKPAGSMAVLTSTTIAKPTFTTDIAGIYIASLIVNDGKVNSTASTVSTTAASADQDLVLPEISLSATAPNDDLTNTTATTSASTYCGYAVGTNRIQGVVSSVHDGDTLTINNTNIRLDSIDAPELAQTYGKQSQQALSALVLNKAVTVAYAKTDKYGRVVGSVFTSDCSLVNLNQVATGSAWYYRAYQCEISAPVRNAYALAEANAQDKNLGLWAANATPPWVYRNGVEATVPVCSSDDPTWSSSPTNPITPVVPAPVTPTPVIPTPTPVTPTNPVVNPTGCFTVYVSGYYRANGTYVKPYTRKSPCCS